MRFASPWALLTLLLLVPLLWRRWRRRPAGLRFASVNVAVGAGRTWRASLRWLPAALEVAALVCLSLALARPQSGVTHVRKRHRAVAIEMVLDISSSMELTVRSSTERTSRLETAKRVFEEFVAGNGRDLAGRPHDLIGMVTFARYPDTVCPLTLAHDALLHFLRRVRIQERPGEDGTAIGDALALAAARLQKAEQALRKQAESLQSDFQIKSKVIVLLTDGENNCGKYLPEEAAALVKKWGVRLYVIGFGDPREPRVVQTPAGPRRVPGPLGADARVLATAAESTGGFFRTAHDADSLRAVYREIDRLEKSEIEMPSYVEYRERFQPWALAAACCVLGQVLLSSTLLRRVP